MFSTAVTLVSLVLSVAGAHQSRPRAVQYEVSRRAQGEMELFKRYSSTRWTFYDAGLGACGQTNVASDFIVALNAEQFGSGYPGPNCFKTITLTYQGKTAQAKIMDRCPGCPYGGLDLSRGLFTYFASEDLGVIAGDWYFNDDPNTATGTTKNPVVTTTSTTKATVAPAKTTNAATTSSANKIATPLNTKAASTSTPHPVTTKTTKASSAKASSATTSSAAKVNTVKSTHKVAPTSSSLATLNQAAVSIPHASTTTSQSQSIPTASGAPHNSSLAAAAAAAVQSSAVLASSFSSILPSATALASAAPANTTAQIYENLQAISVLLTNLAKLIVSAGLGQN